MAIEDAREGVAGDARGSIDILLLGMRVAIIAGFLAAGSLAGQTATFSVRAEATTQEIDTRHFNDNRFQFTVTNNAAALDYITIQRSGVAYANGQQALGVPSPENGVSLGPGESAAMFFRWDLNSPASAGTFTVPIPFRSELNRSQVTIPVTLVVRAAPTAARIGVSGRFAQADGTVLNDATVTVTELTDPSMAAPVVTGPNSTGDFSFSAAPGRYAVVADAMGYKSVTRFLELVAGQGAVTLSLTTEAAAASVDAARVTMSSVSVGNSIWTMRGSNDGRTLATAPMNSVTPGAFHGLREGAAPWSVTFPGVVQLPNQTSVNQFQALDCDVAVSPSGAWVAGTDFAGKAYLMQGATGAVRWSTDRAQDRNPAYPANSAMGAGFRSCGAVAFNNSESRVAVAGTNGHLVVLDVFSGAVVWTADFSAQIRALRFTPDDARLAVGAGDWKFRMLSAQSGAVLWTAENRFWPLFFVAMDGAASLVGSGGKDSEFQLWDGATGALQWKQYYNGGFVSGASIPEAPGNIAVSEWYFGVHGYDRGGREVWMRPLANAAMAATADGRYIFAAGHKPGTRNPAFYLTDSEGTMLWQSVPSLAGMCTVQAPFAGDFFKSVTVVNMGTGVLRASAGCIGGTIVTFTIPVTETPVIRQAFNAAPGVSTLAAGAWAALGGSGLARTTRSWEAGDFRGGVPPTQLDGVSVMVNGRAAPVSYVSPTQVNFLIPPDTAAGEVTLRVTSGGTASNMLRMSVARAAPGFFLLGAGPYVAAARANGLLVGPASLYPGSSRPAAPGETVALFGSGFGEGGAEEVRIGGEAAQTSFAGYVAAGLYQINVTIPPTARAGDNTVTAALGGLSTQPGVMIAVQ